MPFKIPLSKFDGLLSSLSYVRLKVANGGHVDKCKVGRISKTPFFFIRDQFLPCSKDLWDREGWLSPGPFWRTDLQEIQLLMQYQSVHSRDKMVYSARPHILLLMVHTTVKKWRIWGIVFESFCSSLKIEFLFYHLKPITFVINI